MMKKIKKIGALLTIFILNFYNTCFADVMRRFDPDEWERTKTKEIDTIKPVVEEINPVNYIIIGILILAFVACTVFIIRKIIKNNKK